MKKTGWLAFLILGLLSIEVGIIIIMASPLWEFFTPMFVVVGLILISIGITMSPKLNELAAYRKELILIFLLFLLLSLPRAIFQRISISNLELDMIMWSPERILLNMILPIMVMILTILIFIAKDKSQAPTYHCNNCEEYKE